MRWRRIGFAALLVVAGAAGAADMPGPDTVSIQEGDQIRGRINSLSADGLLRITVPYLEREAALRSTAIQAASFGAAAKEADPHRVMLTNGDLIVCAIRSMTATQVVIESSTLGKLTVDRAFVTGIRTGTNATLAPVDVDFTSEDIAPFQPVPGRPGALALEYKHSKPFTVQLDFLPEVLPLCRMSFFVVDPRNPEQESLLISITEDGLLTRSWKDRRGGNMSHHGAVWSPPLRRLEITMNPDRNVYRYVANGKPNISDRLVERAFTALGGDGKYIVLEHFGTMPVRRFRLIEEPDAGQDPGDEDVVQLVNGDRLRADSVTVAEGKLTVRSKNGDVTVPLENVGAVTFRAGAPKTPSVAARSIRVKTMLSTLTLETAEFDGQALTGRAEHLGGAVRVDRAALRRIEFNLQDKLKKPG